MKLTTNRIRGDAEYLEKGLLVNQTSCNYDDVKRTETNSNCKGCFLFMKMMFYLLFVLLTLCVGWIGLMYFSSPSNFSPRSSRAVEYGNYDNIRTEEVSSRSTLDYTITEENTVGASEILDGTNSSDSGDPLDIKKDMDGDEYSTPDKTKRSNAYPEQVMQEKRGFNEVETTATSIIGNSEKLKVANKKGPALVQALTPSPVSIDKPAERSVISNMEQLARIEALRDLIVLMKRFPPGVELTRKTLLLINDPISLEDDLWDSYEDVIQDETMVDVESSEPDAQLATEEQNMEERDDGHDYEVWYRSHRIIMDSISKRTGTTKDKPMSSTESIKTVTESAEPAKKLVLETDRSPNLKVVRKDKHKAPREEWQQQRRDTPEDASDRKFVDQLDGRIADVPTTSPSSKGERVTRRTDKRCLVPLFWESEKINKLVRQLIPGDPYADRKIDEHRRKFKSAMIEWSWWRENTATPRFRRPTTYIAMRTKLHITNNDINNYKPAKYLTHKIAQEYESILLPAFHAFISCWKSKEH